MRPQSPPQMPFDNVKSLRTRLRQMNQAVNVVREVKISAGKEDLYLKKCFHVYNQIIAFKTI